MSHQVRLEDHVYEHIKSKKREGESFSDAIERLTSGHSLRDLREVFDEEQVSEMREAIGTADERDRDEAQRVSKRFE
ncbi:antitoxin VapB family protein [Halobacterium salinarum]|uniref:antitoxin VapB family protein n=1 Tax=Halobacterium salinarum TaxID=2242 RepID=UPI0025535F41|nr:antitoxin VapB family protein [Halobacterium salinarum]MDL0131412.1 antitoxin VapB family protein [Halobacterium salinarum]